MVGGLAVGYLFLLINKPTFISDWIKPWGDIFIRLLRLIAIPLVFVSLVRGIAQMQHLYQLSRLGLSSLVLYLITTTVAVLLGMAMVSWLQPGRFFPHDKAMELQTQHSEQLTQGIENAVEMKDTGPLAMLVNIVPENLLQAGTDNSAMLQIIFVALLIGVAIISLGSKTSDVLLPVFDALNAVILKIVGYIMWFAPLGVFSLMANMVIKLSGESGIWTSLGMYALTVVVTLIWIAYVNYPLLLKILLKEKMIPFVKGVFPIQLVAFSTSSSAATLPFTMEHSKKALGIKDNIASVVFPVGSTINMDGTSAYQAISILFIAQIFGLDLSFSQLLSVVLLTIIASVGTPGVPGASVVMTVMVLTSVGIPVEGMILILAIDRPLDMLRTVVNVTGDVFVAKLIQKWVKQPTN